MPQSLVQFYVHVVFSTNGRRPYLKDESCRERLYAYLAGACRKQESPAINVGGTEDHVHLLLRLAKDLDISALVREVKRESTKWLKKESSRLKNFSWQQGYGAFSLSPSHVETVSRYIDNQVEHHRKLTFQDEFRRICKKYRIELDEQYAWD